jgi:hypothetical protein
VRVNTIIIDDFLDNPDLVRSSALEIDFSTEGQFPGLRSDSADIDYQEMVSNKIAPIIGYDIDQIKYTMDSFRFQICLDDSKTWIHVDDSEWAGVLYLTPGASLNTGTGIFDEEDSLITYVGNVYNRLVLYRGDLFHRSIQPGFGTDISTGRLTQVLFFNISQCNTKCSC